ncbi:Muskelin N-terminus-domain-containing protein [Crucibulum laeve]|uniref:Muskelin N-terminus-domain-containing protein n=1 Tax=Crucibulum laeve TaxID=68775 RepID=A0A5C3MFF3_9AGAR|nr:Muskelin N-terminus-domain-containing protein [Crucibulum laeve]
MKDFKLLIGPSEDKLTEILSASLKNDTTPETFALKHTNSVGIPFPTQYVKIIPISSHGPNFHISIWHVSMTGINDPAYVAKAQMAYEEYRETTALKQILKHLRQRRLLSPFQSIISRTHLRLEHPLVTQLHENLVLRGNWTRAEELLSTFSDYELFNAHLTSCQPHAAWTRLHGTDADGDIPCARGGHAMCIDPINEMIYLFGGWDGEHSLDDFWMYSIKEDKWHMLSLSTSKENNAPGARSCHKMVFDTKTGSIYLLGRLNDSDGVTSATATPRTGTAAIRQQRAQSGPAATDDAVVNASKTYCSEFYRYHTKGVDKGKWDFLSFDTASSGGPSLVFDHQMVIDCDAQILYVFGGRVVDGDWDSHKYSGLYSYNIRLSKWRLLQPSETSSGLQVILPSRFGHSMVLEPNTKTLFIFAGQREEKYLSDMYAYDITTNNVTELFSDFTKAGGPDACFTQRAVIDPNLKEMYIFSGLNRTGSQNVLRSYSSSWVYRYDTRPGKWTQILREPDRVCTNKQAAASIATPAAPAPRYAHQVVYSPNTRMIYMHGGNSGGVSLFEGTAIAGGDGDDALIEEKEGVDGRETRMDDFWRMELRRPGPEEIIRRGKSHIRRQQFREMCEDGPAVKALHFLQTEVSSVVDHDDAREEENFRSLLTHLLSGPSEPHPPTSAASSSSSAAITIPIAPQPPAETISDPTTSSTSTATSNDADDDSERPVKRSRTETPDSDMGSWTNHIDDDDTSGPNTPIAVTGVTCAGLRESVDPIELQTGGKQALSGARYAQRTAVFDGLLEFLSEADKEPVDDFVGLIDQEWGTAGVD